MNRKFLTGLLAICILTTVVVPCFAKPIGKKVTFKITKHSSVQAACDAACTNGTWCCWSQTNQDGTTGTGICCQAGSQTMTTMLKFEDVNAGTRYKPDFEVVK